MLEADPNEIEKMRKSKQIAEEDEDRNLQKMIQRDDRHLSKVSDRRLSKQSKVAESEDSMCSSSCASIDNDYKSFAPKINPDHDIFQVRSSASHSIADIKVITFGGMSSRFWVLRKHISYMPKNYLNAKSMPFFAWQCISLTLSHREIDIVVKDEKDQNNLVKYLLYKMRTVDGKAGSADKLLK